jgi:hypothetical protein
MRRLLLKMLFRHAGGETANIPIFGVVALLSLGVGLFWSVQILLGNYLSGLTKSLLNVKEEIAIYKNPLRGRGSDPNTDNSPGPDSGGNPLDAMRLGNAECAEVEKAVAGLGGMISSPVIKKSDFILSRSEDGLKTIISTLLIGLRPEGKMTVLPILDQLDEAAAEAFSREGGDAHPFLASPGLIAGAKPGEVYELESSGQVRRFRLISLLNQDQVFSVPLLVVPLRVAKLLTGGSAADFVAVRSLEGDSLEQSGGLEDAFDRGMEGKYLVQHWSEALRTINAVFQAINLVISAIVSSLFIVALFFSITLFDILLKRRRKNIAMFLALGLRPKIIRNSLVAFGFLLGLGGFACGLGFCLILLAAMPRLGLADFLASIFITDFSFSFSWTSALIALSLALATSTLSAWSAARRVFRIDPVEDIRT